MIIPIKNQWSWDHIPRNRDLKLQIPYKCNAPSRHLLIDLNGECFVCGCEAWLPISIGKITDFDRLEDIWAHPVAQRLQADINAGTFDNCAVTRCGVQQTNLLDKEYTITINIDQSCNLRCPSCRSEAIMITGGDQHTNKLHMAKHIVSLLENFDKPCRVIMSGNGDVLASSIMRPLLHNFMPKPNQWIKLFTNGLLLRKQLTDNPVIERINEYLISIDAGSKEVYEKVRLGGNWNILLDNFKFLQQNAKPNAQIVITMVLQRDNYHDMKNFCRVVLEHGFIGNITKLEDWGSWGSKFVEHDVLNTAHPENSQAIHELQSVYDQYKGKIWFASGLLQELNIH
jgi:MoaA/NifB/PqqE/SkfB family radical SAM enzyme